MASHSSPISSHCVRSLGRSRPASCLAVIEVLLAGREGQRVQRGQQQGRDGEFGVVDSQQGDDVCERLRGAYFL